MIADSPFVYLFLCTLKNRVLARVKRLRQPRYLLGAVVGAGYLYLVLFRRRVRTAGRRQGALSLSEVASSSLHLAGAILLWLIVAARWLVPVSRQPLELTGPERDLLLVAPVAHRRIIRYKLVRSLGGILASTVVLLLIGRGAIPGAWSFLLGGFLMFTTLRLHLLGISLTRARWSETRSFSADAWVVVALFIAIVASAAAIWSMVPAALALANGSEMMPALALVRDRAAIPAVTYALLPFSIVAAPLLASWPHDFVAAALPVVALAVVNYAWVLHAEDGLQQATGGTLQGPVSSEHRAAAKPSYRRAPFSLSAHGRAEMALVWKNLIMLGRYASPLMLFRLAVPAVMLAIVVSSGRRSAIGTNLFPIAAALTFGLAFLGPYSLRNDLRQDLARLPVLKTWPISGERLLWGEVLAPVLMLASLVWALILVTGALTLSIPADTFPWADRLAIGIAAAIVLPAIVLAQVVIQNAAVVVFPGWVATGATRARGVEALGQQMLMVGGTLLLLVVGLLPGALIGGVAALLLYSVVGWMAAVPAAFILALLLVAETYLAIHFLGAVIERTDPQAVEAVQ